MPFDHNDHYHRLLSRHVPRHGGRALDVGCGSGRFALRLTRLGMDVDAIDPSGEMIAQARALCPREEGARSPRFRQADVTDLELPRNHYDFISCLASIHHVPFETVSALRAALAPGGVLVILGCYREKGRLDLLWSLAAVPVNAVARLAARAADRLRPASAPAGWARTDPPVKQPGMTLSRIHSEAAVLLPGSRIRRLLFWRYLLVFRNSR
ncbi:bifunctional 2-polyprenyl-6-hydroxyphenol methylase/3-demethylubiquinol 3-O-methyltransferase UbiG [Streptomyces sp. WMMB 322]|uniref:class I SAM-dependent methyltransferase n=1 Tax=Streptomyces sp. WMMB 322 TaxID=1286821 RepID=UPI0006E25C03|nr:class I SAM-dependent methyltransferase [Streptomyces sp. WMMB 322]